VLTTAGRRGVTTDSTELLERARRLLPTFKERAFETERLGRVPAENAREILATGLNRISVPVRFGGLDVEFDLLHDIAIEFGRRMRDVAKETKAEALLIQMNPRVSGEFVKDDARTLRAIEDETSKIFVFEGSEGLPIEHFQVLLEGTREDVLERAIPLLAEGGLQIEEFGDRSYRIVATPGGYGAREFDLRGFLNDLGAAASGSDVRERVWASLACHSVTRAGEKLEYPEMTTLLERLVLCENTMHCPHGRPTIVKMAPQAIARLFKRV